MNRYRCFKQIGLLNRMPSSWGLGIHYQKMRFLPPDLELIDHQYERISVKISGAPRAIMECLYLSSDDQGLDEVFELMEGLNNLRPIVVQSLLEACQSIKVKGLSLYIAKRVGRACFNHPKLDPLDLATGKRTIAAGGFMYQSTH